jgi:hypothetical protein
MLRRTGAEFLQPDREGQVIVIAGQRLLMPGKRQGYHGRRRRSFRTEN